VPWRRRTPLDAGRPGGPAPRLERAAASLVVAGALGIGLIHSSAGAQGSTLVRGNVPITARPFDRSRLTGHGSPFAVRM
jgi:hypothetical protein